MDIFFYFLKRESHLNNISTLCYLKENRRHYDYKELSQNAETVNIKTRGTYMYRYVSAFKD